MRSLLISVAAAAAAARTASAFTCPAPATPSPLATSRPKALFAVPDVAEGRDGVDVDGATPDERRPSTSLRRRLRRAALRAWERTDTLRAAGMVGGDDEGRGLAPTHAGFKSNVAMLAAAFLFKWYRARFITKIPVWDRQPQWNMVVTSPEQEKELHAYQCKQCGSTIFIARHREWFFKGGNTECTNCGATGKENFIDIRGEVIDSIDDDYFDYESPLDFVSAAERRKLVKQAGGDEELAKKIAIENAMKNDKEQIQVDGETSAEGGDGGASTTGKKKAKKKGSSKKKDEPVDILDELDMDL